MSCKSSLCLDSCQVCRQQGFLCFLISGFLAFGNMSHFVTVLTTVWDMRLILSVSVKLQLQQSVDKSAAMKTIRYVRCCFNACSKVSLIYCAEPTTTHTHTHTHLTAFFRDYPGEPVPEWQNQSATSQMPFLPPNQQHQGTEGMSTEGTTTTTTTTV